MIQALQLNEFQTLAYDASYVAVFQEISLENVTPIMAYECLAALYGKGALFEIIQKNCHFSYLCFEPFETLSIDNNDNPLHELRLLQNRFKMMTREEVSTLITSTIGYMTYDKELLFNIYRISLTFDHLRKKILISYVVTITQYVKNDFNRAQEKLSQIIHALSKQISSVKLLQKKNKTFIEVDIPDDVFIEKIKKAKQYIIAGDAFQIVLSRSFKRIISVTPLSIYQSLAHTSPAPFMFYIPLEKKTIIGASPEQMVKVHNRQVTVNPIAGTRKRTTESDIDFITHELLHDKKELAEHMMLVDLARNDVGSISEPGSVIVNELMQVKHFTHISHITSEVTGKLKNEYDALDALHATFPAGTLSGAPKIRAMELIDELEESPRGLYGGAICRFDLAGNLDSCIAIRMAVFEDGVATIRTGAGIVYDSDPKAEAQETRQKAEAMLHAIAHAHGELP